MSFVDNSIGQVSRSGIKKIIKPITVEAPTPNDEAQEFWKGWADKHFGENRDPFLGSIIGDDFIEDFNKKLPFIILAFIAVMGMVVSAAAFVKD